jgi:hypothetical protein
MPGQAGVNHKSPISKRYQSLKTKLMRRSLVLTNEAARNPFRQRLVVTPEPGTRAAETAKAQSNLRFFGTSYTGFFILFFGMMV